MRTRIFLVVVLGLAFLLPAVHAFAAGNAEAVNVERAEEEDAALIGLGTVAKIDVNQLTVLEFEYESDAELEVIYEVTETTEYDNVKSLAELIPGDSVEIVYVEQSGKKIVLAISKEENYAEDDVQEPVEIRAAGNEENEIIPVAETEELVPIEAEAGNAVK
jgi:hypothetical protein